MDNLDRKEKKILIDLLVERIELSRTKSSIQTGKRIKWDREMDVHYSFNPQKLLELTKEGRTQKQHQQKANDNFEAKSGEHGGHAKT